MVSHDSAYIVSLSQYDCLPKIWRRLAYGNEGVRFDLSYLSHPNIVSSIKWRKPLHLEQTNNNVLYTFCLDGIVRVWIPTDTADGLHWLQWGTINVNSALQKSPSVPGPWIVCILDGRDFTAAVERSVQDRVREDGVADDVALDYLVSIANKTPEICIAFHKTGLMAVWALDNVGAETATSPKVLDVAKVESALFRTLGGFSKPSSHIHTEAQVYFDNASGSVCFLLHELDGRIGVLTADIAELFNPTANDSRLVLDNIWSGHSDSITKFARNYSGKAIVSRTSNMECIVWQHATGNDSTSRLGLDRRSVIPITTKILKTRLLRKGRFVVLLDEAKLSLWDCRRDKATLLVEKQYSCNGKPLCLIVLPRPNFSDYQTAHLATITASGAGVVWELTLPAYSSQPSSTKARITDFGVFNLGVAEPLVNVLPVDPAGTALAASGFLDVFARDVAVTYTGDGRVDFWTARINTARQTVEWLSTCSTETSIVNISIISGSTLKKVAVVDSSKSELAIWDIGGSRLEFHEAYTTSNSIQDLDWTSTPDSQSILAVGFQYRVILLSQMRFDYLNKGPAWAQIREINIRELTPHPIGDSVWLGDGHLVTGAGNQLFVHDRLISSSDTLSDIRLPQKPNGLWDLFDAVQRFNGPLAVFHPQFLSQCILSGKEALVKKILVALNRTLRYLVPGEVVDDYLGLDLAEFYSPTTVENSRIASKSFSADTYDAENELEVFSEDMATAISDHLKNVRIPQLSGHEQIQLMDIVECMSTVNTHRRSIDENGCRFMLFFRQHALRKGRTSQIHPSWREINWALHSGSQDILLDFVARQTHGPMRWEAARENGIFMWLSDINAVRAQFEVIARNEYTKNDDKSPVDCSLFYLALRKKTVLQGLWRMASGNKEQAATQRLLANNFEDPKWKTAALKNAYALLSKRRFLYAAAFFLLADSLEDAVEVCLRQLKDLQLAIAISRAYGGDSSPVTKKLLHDEVLALAAREGDRWLASWAFWMLGRKDMAVRALITPVYSLLETPASPDLKTRLFLTDDPALIVLYGQLRHTTLQTLRGAAKITPAVEWEFVLHSAKLYDRMGCDLLGLDLGKSSSSSRAFDYANASAVCNWEFQKAPDAGFGGERNPLTLLRRRSSLVVNDLSTSELQFMSAKKPAAAPTMFNEPDADSLLDSFGF